MKKPFILIISLIVSLNVSLAQHQKTSGYKGIWFALGQRTEYGDKYSGGLGTYTSSHIPIAIYAKAVNKTFFVYGGTTSKDEKHLLIMISYFDHNKSVVPKPVIVYDKKDVDDPHDNASVSLDEKGHIWVFVSGRNTTRPGLIFKSRQPYDINDFEKISEGEMTYPQPWWMKNGFLYLFTKYTKGRELYFSTSADGKEWKEGQKIAGMGGHYQLSNIHNGKLTTVFNYHPGGDVNKRTNVYVLQTADNGRTWTNIKGEAMHTPLTDPRTTALLRDYQSEGKLVYLNDINFDAAGNPVILAVISGNHEPGPKADPRVWTIIHWRNGRWNFHDVCRSTHNYDMGSLYIEKNLWQIVGPTEPGPQKWGTGGEMALWVSGDEGRNWKKKSQLTSKSMFNHSYGRRPLNAHSEFYSFWADGDADKFSESRLYFCNKDGTKVWMLPYEMEKELQRPIRIK
ncbi:MAG: BNR-4 repeat-containing protein [Gemmatimonadaceae bacterium]|nr:BNR-4 repeat-containing protein [Chitinophagaceae bacterium]